MKLYYIILLEETLMREFTPIIIMIVATLIVLTTAESWKRWGSFLLTGLLILSGILFLIYSYFRFGEYDTAWYVIFMILALIPLIPVSILSTLIGRWIHSKYHKQKQGI